LIQSADYYFNRLRYVTFLLSNICTAIFSDRHHVIADKAIKP